MDVVIEFVKNNLMYVCAGAGLLVLLIIIICVASSKKKKRVKAAAEKAAAEKAAAEKAAAEKAAAEKAAAEKEAAEKAAAEKAAAEKAAAEKAAAEKEAAEKAAAEKKPKENKAAVKEDTNNMAAAKPEEKGRKIVGKFEVYKVGKVYRYNLKASNGEVMVESELYSSKDGALAAIETLQNSIESCVIKVSQDKKGMYQFKVFAANHRVLVTSANYNTEAAANNAIESFKRFAKGANIVELEEENYNFELCELGKATPKQGGKIQLLKDDEGHFFKVIANNGSVLCTSEDYSSKKGALGGIETLKTAIKDGTFYISRDKNDNYQFKLYSSANRLIAVGETYNTKQKAKSSAASLCNFIEDAEII